MLLLRSIKNYERILDMFGELQTFSVYLNNKLQGEKIKATSSREAAEKYASQNSIEGSWSMGSSKFIGKNGEKIHVRTHY